MTQQQKTEIQQLALQYVQQYSSQSRAAATLRGISEATLIQILKGRWESVSEEMFTSLGKQVGYDAKGVWYLEETLAFNSMVTLLADAKEFGNVFALVAPSGSGKSATAQWYCSKKENAFVVNCAEYYNKKAFLQKMLEAMGKDGNGYTVTEMMDGIVEQVLRMKEPLFVFDEFDKLKEEVFLFFITLYNRLEDKCGIVLLGTDYLEKRIRRGVNLNKRGYSEIYSRVGRKCIHIPPASRRETAAICEANGCASQEVVAEIYNTCEGDLRRVKRAVHAYKQKCLPNPSKGEAIGSEGYRVNKNRLEPA